MTSSPHLVLDRAGPGALALGLRSGDVLVALDGVPFTGGPRELAAQFLPTPRRHALTFDRRGLRRTVLCDTHRIGSWTRREVETAPVAAEDAALNPERLRNWVVFRGLDHEYDAQPVGRPLLALIAPPLWLSQMRLWNGLAVWACLLAMAVPAGWIAVLIVEILTGLYFWRCGPALFRSQRMARGMRPFAVLAARDEASLDIAVRAIEPRLRSVYTARPDAPRVAAPS